MPHTDAKTMLAHALRDALQTVPLSKVTVSGLTRTAGVTRQAFYYHFADIRDLTVWVFKREVANQIDAHSTHEDWSKGLLAMLTWMQVHPEETRSVVSTLSTEDLQVFLYKQLRAVDMSADPTLLTERISRILAGQVRRSLELFAHSPVS